MIKKPHPVKDIVRIGTPLLAGNLSHYLHHVTDSAMVGRLGTAELGAMGIATLFSGIGFTFLWPVTTGVQALTSRRYGRELAGSGSPEATAAVLANGLTVAILTALASSLFFLTAPFILPLLIGSDDLFSNAMLYINTVRYSVLFLALQMAITGFLSGIKQTGAIMKATLFGNLLNILLNYLLIFGKFGFPEMGIRGAALGTVITEVVLVLYLLLVLYRKKMVSRGKIIGEKVIHLPLMGFITKAFLPPMIQNIIALAVFLSYQSLVNIQGTVYLAVTHIAFAMFRINKTIVGGFARGSAILVGNELGGEDPERARQVIMGCEFLAALIGVVLLLTVMLFPGAIVSLFSTDASTIALGIKALRFFAPFYFIEIMGYSFEIIFSSNGWGRYVLFSEFTTNLLFILGMTALLTLVFHFGIFAAWLSFGLYQVFHALILAAGFISGRWKKVQVD